MAYDAATSQVILFGGNNGSYLGNTWAWNGSTWTNVATTGPPARDNAQMAYDPATSQVILFGGINGRLSGGHLGLERFDVDRARDKWTPGSLRGSDGL